MIQLCGPIVELIIKKEMILRLINYKLIQLEAPALTGAHTERFTKGSVHFSKFLMLFYYYYDKNIFTNIYTVF